MIGLPARAFDAWDLGVQTTSDSGNGDVVWSCYDKINELVGRAVTEGLCSEGYDDIRARAK